MQDFNDVVDVGGNSLKILISDASSVAVTTSSEECNSIRLYAFSVCLVDFLDKATSKPEDGFDLSYAGGVH